MMLAAVWLSFLFTDQMLLKSLRISHIINVIFDLETGLRHSWFSLQMHSDLFQANSLHAQQEKQVCVPQE